MGTKKLTEKSLQKLFETINSRSLKAVGTYSFGDFKIDVRRPLTGAERYNKLYHERRDKGLCISCGKKITKKNPHTGKPYRLCDEHRQIIDGSRFAESSTKKKSQTAQKSSSKTAKKNNSKGKTGRRSSS